MAESSVHRRVMIAVDHSINSEYCFNEVMKLIDKENDYLFIVSVSQTMTSFPVNAMAVSVLVDVQREGDQAVHALLVHYVHLCKKAGVKNFKTFLATGSHTGEVICKVAEEKNIDHLFLGRRGIGKLKRIFIGSTSRYCVENAPCTVTCYKLPPSMENLSEHHIKLSDDIHKVSKETYVNQPHPGHVTASSTENAAPAPQSVNVAGIPMVERYNHPV